MSLDLISCIVRLSEEGTVSAQEQAIALAQARGAKLTVCLTGVLVVPPYTPFYAPLVDNLVTEANTVTRKLGEKAAEALRTAAAVSGVTADIQTEIDLVGAATTAAVRRARCSDLIVIDPPVDLADVRQIILEEALFRSGRPVMVAAQGRPAKQDCARLMLAWDGSAHAARALGDALAAFPNASSIEIVSVVGEKDLTGSLEGAEVAHFLARKSIATTLTTLAAGESVARTLDAHAVETGADLIVMGGFGHSRLRQFILGGVTVELTKNPSVPLLMAY